MTRGRLGSRFGYGSGTSRLALENEARAPVNEVEHGLTTRDASMGTEAPTPIVIPVYCAYKKAPCPRCGKRGRRKRVLTRTVRTVAFKAVAFLEITYGGCAARCRCSTTFRNNPEGVPPKDTRPVVQSNAKSHHPRRVEGHVGSHEKEVGIGEESLNHSVFPREPILSICRCRTRSKSRHRSAVAVAERCQIIA